MVLYGSGSTRGGVATVEAVSATKFDEAKLRRIIRAQFDSTDDYHAGFQRAVQAVMKESGLNGVEARWLVMRLRGKFRKG